MHLFHFREVQNGKDRLYNDILHMMTEDGVGFRRQQVGTTGKLVTEVLTNAVWYIDPHRPKFESRGISYKGFDRFSGYNDPKRQKQKIPMVCTTCSTSI